MRDGILPVMEVGNGGNNSGFGNNGDWAWIIVLFLIFGIGNRGFGGYGSGSGVGENYILATDIAQLDNKIDRVNQGLCDGFYSTLENFNTTNMNIAGGFARLDTNLCQLGNNITQSINGLSSQLASCCCDIERGLLENRYLDERNTCNIVNAINMNTRDLLENANNNYRNLHEELMANKLELKNDRIAEQQNEINALRLKASQEAQNAYLINELKPCPSPSYIVPNPNCCYQYNVTPVNSCNGCY